MPFDASVRAYLRAYQNEYRAALHGGQHTAELSFRVPMHEMFRRIAHDLNPAVLSTSFLSREIKEEWGGLTGEYRIASRLVFTAILRRKVHPTSRSILPRIGIRLTDI